MKFLYFAYHVSGHYAFDIVHIIEVDEGFGMCFICLKSDSLW